MAELTKKHVMWRYAQSITCQLGIFIYNICFKKMFAGCLECEFLEITRTSLTNANNTLKALLPCPPGHYLMALLMNLLQFVSFGCKDNMIKPIGPPMIKSVNEIFNVKQSGTPLLISSSGIIMLLCTTFYLYIYTYLYSTSGQTLPMI